MQRFYEWKLGGGDGGVVYDSVVVVVVFVDDGELADWDNKMGSRTISR